MSSKDTKEGTSYVDSFESCLAKKNFAIKRLRCVLLRYGLLKQCLKRMALKIRALAFTERFITLTHVFKNLLLTSVSRQRTLMQTPSIESHSSSDVLF